MIEQGGTLKEVYNTYPGFAMLNKVKIMDWINHFQEEDSRELMDWDDEELLLNYPDIVKPQDAEIRAWLGSNVKSPGYLGMKHLYIWGETGLGKTTLYRRLENYLKIYAMPSDKWHPVYENGKYDLIVFDEFLGQQQITVMNQILDGHPIYLQTKGGGTTYRDFLPMIIFSNLSPWEVYHRPPVQVREAFARRFTVVHIDSMIRVFK